jgi:zinc transporter, ZIP family
MTLDVRGFAILVRLMPEAFQHGGKLVGIATTLGFAVAFAIHTLE